MNMTVPRWMENNKNAEMIYLSTFTFTIYLEMFRRCRFIFTVIEATTLRSKLFLRRIARGDLLLPRSYSYNGLSYSPDYMSIDWYLLTTLMCPNLFLSSPFGFSLRTWSGRISFSPVDRPMNISLIKIKKLFKFLVQEVAERRQMNWQCRDNHVIDIIRNKFQNGKVNLFKIIMRARGSVRWF